MVLNIGMLTRVLVLSKGTKFIESKILKVDEVYIPSTGDVVRNQARKRGLSSDHVNRLSTSLAGGIDYSQCPPVVRKLSHPKVINGRVYHYELVAGFHRLAAMQRAGIEYWIFDVYEFGVNGVTENFAIRTFQLEENNKLPSLPSKAEDIIEVLLALTHGSEPEVPRTEEAITAYVEEHCSHIHGNTKRKIIRKVVEATGAAQDVTTFIFEQLVKYIQNPANYGTNEPLYQVKFEYDIERDKCGASVLEGYEYEFIYSAMQKWAKEARESYFVCHVRTPKEDSSINERRTSMMTEFDKIEEMILATAKFHEENGRFPWSVESFVAQDNKTGERGFIDANQFAPQNIKQMLGAA